MKSGDITNISRGQNYKLCLLSLDGSGTRELSELLILHELMVRIQKEQDLDVPPQTWQYFDLAGGTGTGGYL